VPGARAGRERLERSEGVGALFSLPREAKSSRSQWERHASRSPQIASSTEKWRKRNKSPDFEGVAKVCPDGQISRNDGVRAKPADEAQPKGRLTMPRRVFPPPEMPRGFAGEPPAGIQHQQPALVGEAEPWSFTDLTKQDTSLDFIRALRVVKAVAPTVFRLLPQAVPLVVPVTRIRRVDVTTPRLRQFARNDGPVPRHR